MVKRGAWPVGGIAWLGTILGFLDGDARGVTVAGLEEEGSEGPAAGPSPE